MGMPAGDRASAEAEQAGHHVAQEVGLCAAGRGRARNEVEYLAVLHAVFGDARHLAGRVEIDRQHGLVGHLGRHERELALHLLADVVPGVAADGRGGRRRSHQRKRFRLGRLADLDLIERLRVDLIAAVEVAVVAEAAAQRRRERERAGRREQARGAEPGIPPHHGFPLRRFPLAKSPGDA